MTRPSITRPPFVPLGASLVLLGLSGCSLLSPGPRPSVWPLSPDSVVDVGEERDCDLVHLALDLSIDFEGKGVEGTATNVVRGLARTTHEIRLHGVGLEIESVTDSKGRLLSIEVLEPTIRVFLIEPLLAGAEERITIRYAARPDQGLYFRESSKDAEGFAPQVWTHHQRFRLRHWIPTWDHPSERTTVETKIRVGHGMRVIANGVQVSEELHENDERTVTWRLDRAIPTYLIAVAIGRWERYEDQVGDVPVVYWVAPGTGEEKARRAFGETPAMMAFFETLLGVPFPYPAYNQVAAADFVTGGMENAGLTIVNDGLIGEAGEVDDLDGDPRILVAHELAHQWFGDLVTCWGWQHLWLNEGFASWFELEWVGQVEGEGARRLWLERYREWYLARGRGTRAPLAHSWRTRKSGPDRANHLYTKGPWVVEMMSRAVGREAFLESLHVYLERHADSLVTTHDLVRAIFDTTGHNFTPFVQQWVEVGGHPVLEASHALIGDGTRLEVSLKQVQNPDFLVPQFDLPVTVQVVTQLGRVDHQLVLRDSKATFELPVPGDLLDLVVDADASLLVDLRQAKSTTMWVVQARRSDRPALQWRALTELRAKIDAHARGHAAAEIALVEAGLGSPEPLLRQRAARLLDFRSPIARQALVHVVLNDPSARVRREAAHTLRQHAARSRFGAGDPDTIQLLEHLQSEPSPAVRHELERLLEVAH